MANNRLIITISILIPLAFQLGAATTTTNTTTADEVATIYDNSVNVMVEGKVYCQTCKYVGPWSFSGAQPIRRARVRVICKNYKKRVSYYNTFVTDYDGYFLADLKDYKMSHYLLDHPLQACYVKLVSSPHENCNLKTNVNKGINGSPLRFENKVIYERGYEAVVYAAGPLAFRPNDCYPETNP